MAKTIRLSNTQAEWLKKELQEKLEQWEHNPGMRPKTDVRLIVQTILGKLNYGD